MYCHLYVFCSIDFVLSFSVGLLLLLLLLLLRGLRLPFFCFDPAMVARKGVGLLAERAFSRIVRQFGSKKILSPVSLADSSLFFSV
jgi:hypothetical protein